MKRGRHTALWLETLAEVGPSLGAASAVAFVLLVQLDPRFGSTTAFIAALAVSGMVGLVVAVGHDFLERRQIQRAKQLAAGLEAQAQLETAMAIRQVASDVRVGAERWPVASPDGRYGWDGQAWRPMPTTEEPPPASGGRPTTSASEREGIGQAVDRFYADALLQSRVWFLASVVAAFVGLGVIVWEVLQAGSQPALEAGVKVASGAIAGAIAALFYRQSNTTRKHAAELLTSTQSDRRAETARQILGTIKDDGRREEIAGRLAMHLVGALAASGRRSAERAGPESHPAPATRAARKGPRPAPAAQAEQDTAE